MNVAIAQSPMRTYLPVTLGSVPAALMTAGLIYVMHSLIASDESPPETVASPPIELYAMPDEEIELKPEERAVKPPEPAAPPAWDEPEIALAVDPNDGGGIHKAPPPVIEKAKIDPSAGGGGIVAYLKPAPMYPPRLQSRGVEGFVDLAFDITAAGATANIRVIDSQPEGAFDRAAISALSKWKYRVPVMDGVAQGQVDMMTRMTFALE
ncbi:MAG: TonB family protein [Pseudomonadota bacterium]